MPLRKGRLRRVVPVSSVPHWRRIRTTNCLERLKQEMKRRARVVTIFPNQEARPRVVTGPAVEHSEERVTGRR